MRVGTSALADCALVLRLNGTRYFGTSGVLMQLAEPVGTGIIPPCHELPGVAKNVLKPSRLEVRRIDGVDPTDAVGAGDTLFIANIDSRRDPIPPSVQAVSDASERREPLKVRVPPVRGIPEAKAVEILERAQLRPAVTDNFHGLEHRVITAQRPRAGTVVDPASRVRLLTDSADPRWSLPHNLQKVAISLGHCWMEPVHFDGEVWNPPYDEQFGWGGDVPSQWRGEGIMIRVGQNRARYVDGGGATLLLIPADSPAAQINVMCR